MQVAEANTNAVMMAQVVGGAGFIAALDQSGGSTPGALKAYGVGEDAYSGDEQMFEAIHRMRVRIVTAPSFNGSKVLGAILFEKTMDGQADGVPVPTALWNRGVVPFLKIDKGLEDEADGVKLMKPMPGLADLLDRAAGLGVFGTKARSVIASASRSGIAAIVEQQFEFGEQVIAKGMMPILEPEVLITSADRAESETILKEEIRKALDRMTGDRRVMLKVSIPVEADLYAELVGHHRVARVVALSGGFSRSEASAELAKNHGMIASFSRALLADLRHGMDDAAFDRSIVAAIDEIYTGSVVKN